jgi:hypothetical protein
VSDPLARAEELLSRLEALRQELERAEDPALAIDLLEEIAALARDAQAEVERARREGA